MIRAEYGRNLDFARLGFHIEALGASAHASTPGWLLIHVD